MAMAAEPATYSVFLSHGSPDKPWVRSLYERLTKAGVVAYFDEQAIEAGDNFVRHLSEGIAGTATLVVVVSRDTIDRPWVAYEWTAFVSIYGPSSRIIPVLLDDVPLPTFLRPFQVIHAFDRNAEAIAARIAALVGKPMAPGTSPRYTGQALIFTVTSSDESRTLAVTPTDGVSRTVAAPWKKGNAFGLALMDFEKLTREPISSDATRSSLVNAAQTVGAALFDVLFSDEDLRSSFTRATAPGARAVVSVRSDDDMLLSLPWELLHHDGHFLVRDGMLDVVRSTIGQVQSETLLTPPTQPFTVVTNVSAPDGSGLSYEAESFRIAHALTDHCPQTPTELGTLDDLVETVSRVKPRGIHFSGHGGPGILVFENDEGFEDKVPIDKLVTELRTNGDGALPPFFFLASCHGNTPAKPAEGESGSSSTAAQLHRAGVTEVVGYYGPIADELSTRAEEALYAGIASGESTRTAVTHARRALLRQYDGDPSHRPAGWAEPGLSRAGDAVAAHATPFAWAQLVFYHRGPEHPLGTPASVEKLRQREAALRRTYRQIEERVFLENGFIGRRRELHQLRRRRRRGDHIFVLQGLGGLGKTTLAGHLLPQLADPQHTVTIWCRRTEGEQDQAEALVGQLLRYARERFGSGFEQVVSHVDRTAGDDAVRRFAMFLEVILQQDGAPLVVYLDNLESLLHGPDAVSLDTAPDSNAFGTWRSDGVKRVWQALVDLAGAVANLFVVASCRYRNRELPDVLPVSPLIDADLMRLMAWFPALRRLSTRTRARLATRLSGHPRAVEFMDALVAGAIRSWERTHEEWTSPAFSDVAGVQREWDQLVEPVLPNVQERIWSDLLLAQLWARVLDNRARRMLFRMTLLRRPWDDGLIACLGEPDEDAELARRTAHALSDTSLLEQIELTVSNGKENVRRSHFTLHAATIAFVRIRFTIQGDLVVASHRRIGDYLEEVARTSPDISLDVEAGHHLFEAEEYNRAYRLLGAVSDRYQNWGRVREGMQILQPFLDEAINRRMSLTSVGRLIGTIGNAYAFLGENKRAIEHHERTLVIMRQIGDRRGEAIALDGLGNAYNALGEVPRAIELFKQHLETAREINDRQVEGGALANIATAYGNIQDNQNAIEYNERALTIARELGYRKLEAIVLGNLGATYRRLGEIRRAIQHHDEALLICREIGDRRSEGANLGNLGTCYADLGEAGRAIALFEQRLGIAREIGDRRGECYALGFLGTAYARLAEPQRARKLFEKAVAIGQAIGEPYMTSFCTEALDLLPKG